MKSIKAVEQWCYRRTLKIGWKYKVVLDTEVLKRVGEKEQQFSTKIVQQKLEYAGGSTHTEANTEANSLQLVAYSMLHMRHQSYNPLVPELF